MPVTFVRVAKLLLQTTRDGTLRHQQARGAQLVYGPYHTPRAALCYGLCLG